LDITDLEVGDSVHVHDIHPPEHVDIPADVNFTVVTVVGTKTTQKIVGEVSAEEVAEEVKPKKGKG
jgi:large subunit ribosomal protein L25